MIEKIIEAKKLEVGGLKRSSFGPRKRPVRKLALDGPVNIIAELKRKSPSAGFIGEIDEARIAAYSRYARAISVLTDSAFFGGSYEFLDHVAGSTDLPVLCKDFVIDPKQMDRAYAAGADLVLLIARILTGAELELLYSHARDLGLSCLVEIHEREELDAIVGLDPDMVGVNARDLDTLEIDLEKAAQTLSLVRAPVRIAESGIRSRHDIERMGRSGANGFLVGEALMRSKEPAATFEELLHG
ncbi:MAG: indole-3-glycerol phosphate synthase TrpC [Syntrophorhabdales bacterium]|jgi:indole-3-glycerol phosphate synthase